VSGSSVNTTLGLTGGQHNIVVQALDQAGGTTKQQLNVTVQPLSISIFSPTATAYAPVHISTNAHDPSPIQMTQIYVDNALRYEMDGSGVQAPMNLTAGPHTFVVQEWNAAGATYKKTLNINVVGIPVTFSAPTANTTVSSPVQFKASTPSSAVTVMQLYVDNVLKYHVNGTSLNTTLALSSGSHYVVAQAWDIDGGTWKTAININVK
jgi:hypothetical protein